MCTIPAFGNRKSCLIPVFLTIYDFASLQFSDILMSNEYFHICLKAERNQNVSKISIDPLSELIVSVLNTDKIKKTTSTM